MKLLSNYRRSYLTMFCSAEILVDTRVAIEPKKASHHSLRFVSLLVCLLCQLLWKTRCARRTVDQSNGIYNSYSTVARDLWQRKPPLSSGCALGLGSVYCHKSLAPCYNYNKSSDTYFHLMSAITFCTVVLHIMKLFL